MRGKYREIQVNVFQVIRDNTTTQIDETSSAISLPTSRLHLFFDALGSGTTSPNTAHTLSTPDKITLDSVSSEATKWGLFPMTYLRNSGGPTENKGIIHTRLCPPCYDTVHS